MTNAEVCRAWSGQHKPRGRNEKGSLYFDGPTIYSYGSHFPIATHRDGVVLFTTRSHSVTTAGHKSEVRQAISVRKVFYVDPGHWGDHAATLKAYTERFLDAVKAAGRARVHADYKWDCAETIAQEARAYATRFGVTWEGATCSKD